MLYDEPVLFHRGLTIFRDFSNLNTFYFLPREAPRIARTGEGGGGGDYALRLVLYRPDPNAPPPQGMENGGGFLNLDTDLHVTESLLEDTRQEIRRRFGAEANLVPVPFLDGSVELVLLGVGREDENQPFVRKVAGSTVPSMYGSERAAFSVVLDRDGAALMRQVIEAGGTTMALAIYHLTYAGIGPAYNLKLTIDYERVYEHLDLRLGAQISAGGQNKSFVGKAGFHLLMAELREKRAIKVEEVDPVPGENGRTPVNQEMIDEIIGNLMGSKWFKPTLAQPAQLANIQQPGGGTESGGGGGHSSSPSGSPTTTTSAATTTTTTSAHPASPPGGGQPAHEESQPAAAERQQATWTEDSREPTAEFPQENGIEEFHPSSEGTRETLGIRGQHASATIDGQPAQIENGQLPVDVPAGETKNVVVTWAGQERDTFHVFFEFDRPTDGAEVSGYSQEAPPGGDSRFTGASQDSPPSTTGQGPAGLRQWLANLNSDQLELHGYASYEGDDTDAQHNRSLSQRRLNVAANLIERFFPGRFTIVAREVHGHDPAKLNAVPTLTPGGGPVDSHGSKPEHRVGQIIVRPRPESTIRGHLTRPDVPTTTTHPPTTTTGGPGTTTSHGPGTTTTPRPGEATKIEASFEVNLDMIQQEERITASYELSSRKARTQEVHPQGQLVLDAIDPSKYIIEADGAIDFFQWLDIEASTTSQWEAEGIGSIQIQIRYGPRGDGSFMRTGDLLLTPDEETATWRAGVLHENDDDALPVVYWYEYRVTVHFLPDVALGDQQGAVTSVGVEGADPEGWLRTFSRNLVIHPRDVTPAITVTVTTGLMRFDLLERAQLVLRYGPYRQNLNLSADKPEQRLVIRPEEGLENESIRTEGMLFYKDGAQIALPAHSWVPQELIVINEPRENTLRVSIVLADPGHEYERVRVRLRHEHGNRVVEDAFELTRHAQLEEWAVRLEDPGDRGWKYQATLIKRSGDIDTIDWKDGKGERLILGIKAEDVIPVQVTWLMPPPAGDLIAVKIDLEYEDDGNDLRWDHSELIRGDHPGTFNWAIPIMNEDLRTYRYRVTEFRQTGAQEGPWLETNTTSLVLLPGN